VILVIADLFLLQQFSLNYSNIIIYTAINDFLPPLTISLDLSYDMALICVYFYSSR